MSMNSLRLDVSDVSFTIFHDVIIILDNIKFFFQVFARIEIYRDLDVATRVARTDGLDCITVEGFVLSFFVFCFSFFIYIFLLIF